MLDSLPDKYYTCGMENLCNSRKFLWEVYAKTKYKVMVHGVFQKKGRGLPKFVIQEDYTKDRKKDDIMKGKTKADVLEGVLSVLILWCSLCMTLSQFIFCLWRMRSWCGTSIKRIFITRQIRKGQYTVLSH